MTLHGFHQPFCFSRCIWDTPLPNSKLPTTAGFAGNLSSCFIQDTISELIDLSKGEKVLSSETPSCAAVFIRYVGKKSIFDERSCLLAVGVTQHPRKGVRSVLMTDLGCAPSGHQMQGILSSGAAEENSNTVQSVPEWALWYGGCQSAHQPSPHGQLIAAAVGLCGVL